MIKSLPISISAAVFTKFTTTAFLHPKPFPGFVARSVQRYHYYRPTNLHTRPFSAQTRIKMSSTDSVIPGRPTWQQTMIRIKDPAKSLKFYCDLLGMTHIDTFDFPQYKFSIYFVTTLPEGETYNLTPQTKESHDYCWNYEGVTLELTHNYGTEDDDEFSYHAGNQERDGFGHVAVSCDDVYGCVEKLEKAGVSFKKKPDEGRMKGLAFAYDPDGYWVEIIKRGTVGFNTKEYNFSQTMLRVKDPKKSIAFYQRLGMKLMAERRFSDFSLYFLSSNVKDEDVPEDPTSQEAIEKAKDLFNPVLELTHNHGTENDEDFKHFHGNEEGKQGFGHVGFLVDDAYAACDAIREMGYGFRKEVDGGSIKGLAFAYDPDGYSVEIIPRGGVDFGDKRIEAKKE